MSDCIISDWPKDHDGYGRRGHTSYGNLRFHHRVVWAETHGPIPPGMQVRHTCDNPSCVNIEHLLVGTHADNMRDKADRLRPHRGEQVNTAKLTEADVLAIHARPDVTNVNAIAREYGVRWQAISDILAGRSWRHLLGASQDSA